MKKILTTALAIVLFAGASQAQSTHRGKDHHRGGPGKEWTKDLNLTDAQKAQLKTLHEAQQKEIEALKSTNVTPEQRKAIHEKYRSQFEAVLTPAQREQMKAKMHEHKAVGGHGFDKKGGFSKNAAFLNKDLNLTTDQQAKLQGFANDFHAKAQGIRGNTSLTDDQKKEQLKNLAKQFREQTQTVLTPEQAQKMKELRGARKMRVQQNS